MLRKKNINKAIIYILLVVIILPFLVFPGYWMVITSIKPLKDAISVPPIFFPRTVTFDSFLSLLQRSDFIRPILNSIVVSIVTVSINILVASLAAFALSRFKYRIISTILIIILLSQMLPNTLFLIPHFINMRRLGLLNSYQVLILSYTAMSLPFTIWMMTSYFNKLPFEIDEAALIDGATKSRLLFSIILPLAKPCIASVSLYSFLLSWNEYVFGATLITSKSFKTLPVAISEFAGELMLKWDKVMAACVISSIPILILFIFAQKSFVQGLTGGVKT